MWIGPRWRCTLHGRVPLDSTTRCTAPPLGCDPGRLRRSRRDELLARSPQTPSCMQHACRSLRDRQCQVRSQTQVLPARIGTSRRRVRWPAKRGSIGFAKPCHPTGNVCPQRRDGRTNASTELLWHLGGWVRRLPASDHGELRLGEADFALGSHHCFARGRLLAPQASEGGACTCQRVCALPLKAGQIFVVCIPDLALVLLELALCRANGLGDLAGLLLAHLDLGGPLVVIARRSTDRLALWHVERLPLGEAQSSGASLALLLVTLTEFAQVCAPSRIPFIVEQLVCQAVFVVVVVRWHATVVAILTSATVAVVTHAIFRAKSLTGRLVAARWARTVAFLKPRNEASGMEEVTACQGRPAISNGIEADGTDWKRIAAAIIVHHIVSLEHTVIGFV
mmetsp:Transcript_4704/g.12533  ORF Transcript_4704/g.12533 Transcript_4704/m.12533 type:complete len:395 (-) Transcript_4704:97-1281(-)